MRWSPRRSRTCTGAGVPGGAAHSCRADVRRCWGVVLAALGVGVANWVVAELGEHPGAENDPQAGLAEVDLSVRVLAKTLLHLPGQHLGLLCHRRQNHD